MKSFVLRIIGLTFTSILFIPVGLSAEKKVLVIESYHKEMFWDAGYRKGIKETLGQRISIHFFEMDTKRLPKAAYPERIKAAISSIDNVKPDLIILGDDNALNFLGNEVLKRKIPLVFLGINNNPRLYFNGAIPLGMTGVLEMPQLKRHLNFIKEIEPDWKKVLVLFDNSNTSNIYKNAPYYFQGKSEITISGLSVEIYLTSSYEELQAKVKKAQDEKDVLFIGGLNTLTNAYKKHISTDEATNWIYKNSNIPLFGFWRGMAGPQKSIGGYVIDGESMGVQAAKLASQILNGTPINMLPIERLTEGHLVLSKSGLSHWNIEIPKNLSEPVEYID